MPQRNDTMAEGLQKMLGEISVFKTLPDADLQFLTDLETMILKKLREPIEAIAQQQAAAQQQAGSQATGAPIGGVGGVPTPGGGPQGVPGVMSSPGNPDEIRRMLAGG